MKKYAKCNKKTDLKYNKGPTLIVIIFIIAVKGGSSKWNPIKIGQLMAELLVKEAEGIIIYYLNCVRCIVI